MATKTINVEPNYENLYKIFSRDAIQNMTRLTTKRKNITLSEVYDMVQAIRMTLHSCTTGENLMDFRDRFSDEANKMFEQVQK